MRYLLYVHEIIKKLTAQVEKVPPFVSTVKKNDGKINKNGQEQRGKNDGAPSRSLTRS